MLQSVVEIYQVVSVIVWCVSLWHGMWSKSFTYAVSARGSVLDRSSETPCGEKHWQNLSPTIKFDTTSCRICTTSSSSGGGGGSVDHLVSKYITLRYVMGGAGHGVGVTKTGSVSKIAYGPPRFLQ